MTASDRESEPLSDSSYSFHEYGGKGGTEAMEHLELESKALDGSNLDWTVQALNGRFGLLGALASI